MTSSQRPASDASSSGESQILSGSYLALSQAAFTSLGSMEGLYESIVEVSAPPAAKAKVGSVKPGFIFAAAVAGLAYGVHYLPFAPFEVVRNGAIRRPISAAIAAILLGALLRNLLPLPQSISLGCKRIIKKAIPYAIVLIGAGLNLNSLAAVGFKAFFIVVVSMAVALATAYLFGRFMGMGKKVSMLIGAGTAICGNSAIAAVAPLIEADDEDLVLSIGTINLFGLLAMVACPLLGGWMGLSSDAFGIWAGVSIHAVPQVVAAGFALSPDAGTLATLIKLVRVAMLAPLVFGLAIVFARQHADANQGGKQVIIHYARFVPWFVWGFLGMALMGTMGLIPTLQFEPSSLLSDSTEPVLISLQGVLEQCGKILLTWAMAAIGLEVNLRLLAGVSGKAILNGLVASIAIAGASLALILLLI